MAQVLMPQMGFDMQEGKLVRWLKKPGDRVERNEPIAEIETDKAVMEIEAYDAGVITKLLVEEGANVPVGEPIAIVDTGDGAADEATPEPVRDAADDVPPAAQPAQATSVAAAEPPVEEPAAPEVSAVPTDREGAQERIKASPLARRIARERGIDLRLIKGTGPGGRIVKADVDAAAAAPQPATSAPATPVVGALASRQVPLSRMREVIAERMVASKQQAPHFYITMSVDMDDAMAFRKQFNETVGEANRISVNDLVVKACGLALATFPELNASFGGNVINYHDSADIAIAVAVEGGLITPVVRGCHAKSLAEIGAEARELAEAARAGRLRPDQYQGGTFTVSNLGMFGVDDFIAIINPPQAAILAVGAITPTPVVRDGEIVVRQVMRMTLSADHRVTDGAQVAQFLQEVKAVLEKPLRLLMPPRTAEGGAES